MSDEYAICKRCDHLKKNHLLYQADNKCTKCDCQEFIEQFSDSFLQGFVYEGKFT